MTTGRRAFAWAALGAAAFTLYGSLVPFQFRALAPGDAAGRFLAILAGGPKLASRSDAVANVMLGAPLGFALLGLVCADRGWPRRQVAGRAVLLLPVAALFAVGVEFAQLFTPGRNCSAADILAQTLGAAAGMGAWLLVGQRFTYRARAAWARADLNAAGRLLVAYVALVAFLQTLPFDLSASPYGVYRKFRDGEVQLTPFGEFEGMTDAQRWQQSGKLAKLAGLFIPVGLLAARVKGRIEQWSLARVALAALALTLPLEVGQLLVQSRSASTTDAAVGALAALAGWFAGRIHHEGLALPFFASWLLVWLAGMTPVVLPPPGAAPREAPRAFDWMPGLPLESGDPLRAPEEVLTKLVLFGLLGVLVAGWWLPPRTRRGRGGSLRTAVGIAAGLGLLLAGLVESNQRWHDSYTPCLTDVLLGGLGAALGVLAGSRARGSS